MCEVNHPAIDRRGGLRPSHPLTWGRIEALLLARIYLTLLEHFTVHVKS